MIKRMLVTVFMAFAILLSNHAMSASQAEAQDVWVGTYIKDGTVQEVYYVDDDSLHVHGSSPAAFSYLVKAVDDDGNVLYGGYRKYNFRKVSYDVWYLKVDGYLEHKVNPGSSYDQILKNCLKLFSFK